MPRKRTGARVRRERGAGAARARGNRGQYSRQWTGDRLAPKQHLSPPAYASIEEVPRDIYDRAMLEKLPWIRRFVNEGCPRGELKAYAEEYARGQGIPVQDVPPYSTLNGWVHRYRAFGLLGLMDKVRSDAGHARTISSEVADAAITLRAGGKFGPSAILTALHGLFPATVIPNYSALRRHIRRYEKDHPHLMVMVDEGMAGWRNKFRLAMAGTNYPGGDVYSVDSTVSDLWVRVRDNSAADGWSAVRLVLTVIEDVGSRLLISFNLSFKAVDSGILLGAFRRVVVQEANYPGLLSPGLPRRILLDKGAEHQSAFLEMLKKYEIEVLPGEAYHPERNGRLERLIQTVQTEVFGHLPGYAKLHTRFNPYAPAEKEATRRLTSLKYDPYKLELPVMALKTVEEVEAEICGWGHVYNARSHSGLPADLPELKTMLAKALELDNLMDGAA